MKKEFLELENKFLKDLIDAQTDFIKSQTDLIDALLKEKQTAPINVIVTQPIQVGGGLPYPFNPIPYPNPIWYYANTSSSLGSINPGIWNN